GGHKNIERIEDILNSSKIEFISLSRPLVSEPDLINRWIKDRSRAKCISCNRCFLNGKRCVLISNQF
ncbi:MAG: NADH:flavin oxidoreductase, partial [Fusobacteriaceae bacterium]